MEEQEAEFGSPGSDNDFFVDDDSSHGSPSVGKFEIEIKANPEEHGEYIKSDQSSERSSLSHSI